MSKLAGAHDAPLCEYSREPAAPCFRLAAK